MRKHNILKDFKMGKHFILTQPAKIDDVVSGDFFDDDDYGWREKARKLQVRRWRKLKHHMV